MARRAREGSQRMIGVGMVCFALVLFVVLLVLSQQTGFWVRRTTLVTDFRTISGLRRDSAVHCAGVRIGTVQSIDFVTRRYVCNPATEDIGRHGAGRTNDCDTMLFCASNGLCADLEPYAAKEMHRPCLEDDDCSREEICVTTDFRRRARRVSWSGPEGMCARFNTDHKRVQVTMSVLEESLVNIGADSRATVASSGVLGDQMINITGGGREPLGEDHRLQSVSSFSESVGQFRDNFGALSDKVESGLSGISSTFAELNDENTIAEVKQTLGELQHETDDIAGGRGRIGPLLHDPAWQQEFSSVMRKTRDTATFVDGVVHDAKQSLAKVDRDIGPRVSELRAGADRVRTKLDSLRPGGTGTLSKLLHDPAGELTGEVERSLANVRSTAAAAVAIARRHRARRRQPGRVRVRRQGLRRPAPHAGQGSRTGACAWWCGWPVASTRHRQRPRPAR
ncbi:MAG: hypothetical protein U0168_25025 [Nannocystaceae bacterium]